jgi:hypothetical protein
MMYENLQRKYEDHGKGSSILDLKGESYESSAFED